MRDKYAMDGLSAAASALGKVGGASKSPAKSAASRENGRLGGRPPLPVKIELDGYTLTQCRHCGTVTVEFEGATVRVLADGIDLADDTAYKFILSAFRPVGC
jgi:hypothetical protein